MLIAAKRIYLFAFFWAGFPFNQSPRPQQTATSVRAFIKGREFIIPKSSIPKVHPDMYFSMQDLDASTYSYFLEILSKHFPGSPNEKKVLLRVAWFFWWTCVPCDWHQILESGRPRFFVFVSLLSRFLSCGSSHSLSWHPKMRNTNTEEIKSRCKVQWCIYFFPSIVRCDPAESVRHLFWHSHQRACDLLPTFSASFP